jgi:hypothetical protein
MTVLIESLVSIFGPFVFPVVIFVGGAAAYGVMLLLTRRFRASGPPNRR